jgi:hypothetical protein
MTDRIGSDGPDARVMKLDQGMLPSARMATARRDGPRYARSRRCQAGWQTLADRCTDLVPARE